MIERRERRPYWKHTKWQMMASLLPFLFVVIVLLFNAEQLTRARFIGFPWSYFLLAHGVGVLALITVASFVNRQDMIDRWHGAHEDS